MAETISASPATATKRCAVVTGANKGIGLEVCRQLSSNGFLVVLTARDENRGIAAVEYLKVSEGVSDLNLIFHQLDVTDSSSIDSLANFIKTQFGKLDLLCKGEQPDLKQVMTQNYELAEECLKTNYFGIKEVTEALIPFLQQSNSARIINVSSSMGQLKNLSNEKAKEVLTDVDDLTEERVNEVLNEFLKDFKEDVLEAKGWPCILSAYTVSKATLNAYTRILAKRYPTLCINCVCPGYVKTDINCNTGVLSVEEGAESVVRLALLSDDGPPSGCFFIRSEVSSF